jgi:hypothetical protein
MEYRGLINLRLCLNVAVGQKGKNTCRYKLTYLTYPFSFEGKLVQYIEDATYIWHTDKTRESLRNMLNKIENILREIKQHGRQIFLEKESSNFSRIVHDYSEAKKGFVVWKGMLEEILV